MPPLSPTPAPQARPLPGVDSLHPLCAVPDARASLVPGKEAVQFRAALCVPRPIVRCDGGANLHGVTRQLIVLPSGVYHRNATEADPTTKLIGLHFDFFGELNINREEDMVILEEGVMEGKIAVEAVEESCSPLSEERYITLPTIACNSWSNAILAERLGMSEDYTSKLFRQIVGIPPGE
ncbi:hypothetical protein D3C76_147860 [compost metagenome]